VWSPLGLPDTPRSQASTDVSQASDLGLEGSAAALPLNKKSKQTLAETLLLAVSPFQSQRALLSGAYIKWTFASIIDMAMCINWTLFQI